MSEEKTFANGLVVKRNDNAPDWVLCNLSVKVSEFVEFLNTHQSNGWVNIKCNVGKSGKPYAELDTWKPTQGDAAKAGVEDARQAAQPKAQSNANPAPTDFEDDIPFSNYEYRTLA